MSGVLFDARWVRPGMTGVGRYAYNLLRGTGIPRERCAVILTWDCPQADDFAGFRIFRTGIDITAHPRSDLFEQFLLPWLCWRHGYNALVSFEGRVPVFHPGIRTYPIIYDMTFAQEKDSHSLKYRFFLGMHARLSRWFATRVITISETVRKDLIVILGMRESKVVVVYPAGSRLADHAPVPIPDLQGPFFLAVGITNTRKNLPAILAAFAIARSRTPGLRLAVSGTTSLITAAAVATAFRQGMEAGSDTTAASQTPAEAVLNLGFVGEGQLRWLYEHAAGLVFASRNEGFGIPLVDAAEFHCPLLCSDIPVFREVAGEAAEYFNPRDPADIARAMASALAEPAEARSRAARLQGRFSWDRSAKALTHLLGLNDLTDPIIPMRRT
ncbi:MAG: glycosyltransferase family 1 protein [Fibrobacteria bacterium]